MISTFLMLWLVATVVSAEVYQWRDERGRLQFSDSPPEAGLTNRPSVKTIELQPLVETQSVAPKPSVFGDSYWRDKELSARKNKQQRRLERERKEKQQMDKQRRCQKTRSQYRAFRLKTLSAKSLEALRKKRDRGARLKRLIKEYCY